VRRPQLIISGCAFALTALTFAAPAQAQVSPPPAGAGQPSSFVIDGAAKPAATTPGSTAPTQTTAPATKKKARATSTPTTIDVRPLEPASAAAPASSASNASNGGIPESVWAALRKCESNGNYAINTGNGYYGAYQFAASTWRKLGYSGLPHEAAPAVQDEAARKLQASAGWGPWPACTRKLGLR
jgi:resuscitation-promoting factor RpfA